VKPERNDQVPPYAAETAREIRELGPGGTGNFESTEDAQERGVTPSLADQARKRAVEQEGVRAAQTGDDHARAVRTKAEELWVLEGKPEGSQQHYLEMAESLLAQRTTE